MPPNNIPPTQQPTQGQTPPNQQPTQGQVPPNQQPTQGQVPPNPTLPQGQPPAQQSLSDFGLVSPKLDSQVRFMETVVDNMLSGQNERVMIGGDTGLGKTSFVKQFARLFGFPSIIVEIPHTVEEQMINIPFIVFDKDGRSQQGYDQVSTQDAKVVLGSSYLATALRKLDKANDADYSQLVKSYDSVAQELIKQYEKKNPGEISIIRSKYKRILFLDEFYRKTTPSIRNILRNILNGRIGNDIIPEGTYVMYASNLSDVGDSMDSQSQHTEFNEKIFPAPTKDQWLSYTISSAIGKKVTFKKEVVDSFNKNLRDEHISYNDINTGLRTSPRRWSEILLYINNAFPFKSPEEAGILLTTVKRQFQDDQQNTSDVFNILNDIIKDLCVKSKIPISALREIPATQWRKVLAQQVMTSLSVGESKKYVPVIQGLPGVGKTAIGETFEEPPYNLRFIPILATTLTRDSVIGIPLPTDDNNKKGVQFAEPELYIMIMDMIKTAEQSYMDTLYKKEQAGELKGKSAEDAYQEYQQQQYKYLIFFDEINRVKDVSIFNSLRRVILEKEFNDQYKLPKSALILGAMNPADLGTQPLTGHFRDAIELIDVEPNWKELTEYLKTRVTPWLKQSTKTSDTSLETALKIVEGFPRVFSSTKKGRASNEFYVNVGVEEVYISPRAWDNIYKALNIGIERALRHINQELDKRDMSDEEVNEKIVDYAFEKLESKFRERFRQADVGDPPGFFERLLAYLNGVVDVSLTKQTTSVGLVDILMKYVYNENDTELKDDSSFDNYMDDYMPATFEEDFDAFLDRYAREFQDMIDYLPSIVQRIKDAVDHNGFELDSLDRVENSVFKHLNKILQDSQGGFEFDEYVEYARAYQNVLDILES